MVRRRRVVCLLAAIVVVASEVVAVEIGQYRQLLDALKYGGPSFDPPIELTDTPLSIVSQRLSSGTIESGNWFATGGRDYTYDFDSDRRIVRSTRTWKGDGATLERAYSYRCSTGELQRVDSLWDAPNRSPRESYWTFERAAGVLVERLFEDGELSKIWSYDLNEAGMPLRVTVESEFRGRRLLDAVYLATYKDDERTLRSLEMTDYNGERVWLQEFEYPSPILVRIEYTHAQSQALNHVQALHYDGNRRMIENTTTWANAQDTISYAYDDRGRWVSEITARTEYEEIVFARRLQLIYD